MLELWRRRFSARPKLPGPLRLVQGIAGALLSKEVLDDAVKLAGVKLREANAEAVAKHTYLTAMLTGFRIDLDKGEEDLVLLRSRR